jgi:arginyl-tRNA synthetase
VFHSIEKQVSSAFHAHIQARYGVDLQVNVEQPRQSEFGEMAVPAAFQLAKHLRQAPKKIAAELVDEIGPIPGVAALEVAGNGYINIRLDRGAYAAALFGGAPAAAADAGEKIIVEHTNINPNKAAHIGHLRNAVLGDTFVRMLRAQGQRVEVQNYIDNTGVQVADVVVGFHYLENKTSADVKALLADPAVRFDYYCWDLYARTSSYYKHHSDALAWRSATLHAIEAGVGEAGEGDVAELAHLVADAIVEAHLATMLRLDVEYDVLPRESEILHLQFWAAAFEQLKERKAIYFETEGKNAGCWVMPGLSEEGKVIVRSDGTVTYVGKDIAYQLWKFGLLGKDFYYRPFKTYQDGRVLYVTTDKPGGQPVENGQQFGHATRVYNVIDTRQSYLQDVVVAGLRGLGYENQAGQSIHFSYEMVALSPRCCADLGIPLSDEDRKKPYVEVAGRKGIGVKADDLMDELIAKALEEVASRHAENPPEENRRVATQIAVAALRFFLLKYTRNTVIAFDLQEALSFEGGTGPYVQYAAVRARNILRKLEAQGEKIPDFGVELSAETLARQLQFEDFWQMLLAASKADWAVENAVVAGEPAHVATFAFQLAQAFSNFYQKYSIIHEENREKKVFLLWMTEFFRSQLERTAAILGIQIPAYM